MPRVGRKRTKDLHLPAGVREIAGTWYWQPPTAKERRLRAEQREQARAKGERFTISVTLGPANSLEARVKWAEVSGFRAPAEIQGKVLELLQLWERIGITKTPKGKPRADSTIARYRYCLTFLEKKFGPCAYGKTNLEAARGQALGTADVQAYIAEHPSPALANQIFAVLDNVFQFAIRRGKTTYNPCADVVTNEGGVREREALPWEVEVLQALAGWRMGLMIAFEAIAGWRPVDMLTLKRLQGQADGVRVRYRKVGKRWLWEWTPELRRIWAEAEKLPFASKFPASNVFPARGGKELGYRAFNLEWVGLITSANALLAEGILDVDTLALHAGAAIEDLQFRDLRSKAHDDAEDEGRRGNDLLGNTPSVARRHYSRREKRVRPLR